MARIHGLMEETVDRLCGSSRGCISWCLLELYDQFDRAELFNRNSLCPINIKPLRAELDYLDLVIVSYIQPAFATSESPSK